MSVLLALVLAQAAPAAAPPLPAAVQEALDPARLAAAQSLVDTLMPQDMRDGMIDTMLKPMMANLQQMIVSDPTFARVGGGDPAVRAVFDRFMARRNAATIETLRVAMPDMVAAITRAYARRFSVQQMADARTFFAPPSGQAYVRHSTTIMSDPDVLAWQRSLMQRTMAEMPGEIRAMAAEMQAAGDKK